MIDTNLDKGNEVAIKSDIEKSEGVQSDYEVDVNCKDIDLSENQEVGPPNSEAG